MASSSANAGTTMQPMFLHPIAEKLTKINHPTWKAQALATIRGMKLYGLITGTEVAPAVEIDGKDGDGKTLKGADGKTVKVPNPAYEDWLARDQQVLSFLLSSISKEILPPVAAKETAAEAWKEIESMFSSQTRARAVNTRIVLSTMKKGNLSMAEYFSKMRALGDEMAAAGRRLADDELIEYILTGLDFDYNPVVSAILARPEMISLSELYSQLLAFETRLDLLSHTYDSPSSANSAQRGRGGGRGFGRGPGRGRGNPTLGRGQDSGAPMQRAPEQRRANNNEERRPVCQVCRKEGHTADRCWHRFNRNYVPAETKHVAATATNSYNADTSWILDSGATDHITGELEKLTVRDKYYGGDQIHTANGSGSGNEERPA